MRINVYSQEITSEISTLSKPSDGGAIYSAVRLFLASAEELHHSATDDDRSAITFWMPKSPERRESIARTFEMMAFEIRNLRPETGKD